MVWLLPILTKIGLWVLPKLLGTAVDYLEKTLYLVEQADKEIEDPAARRQWVLDKIDGGTFGQTISRWLLEACVILHGIGVTATQLDATEALVREADLSTITTAEKRAAVIARLQELFPSMPERIARFLTQLAVMKIQAAVGA